MCMKNCLHIVTSISCICALQKQFWLPSYKITVENLFPFSCTVTLECTFVIGSLKGLCVCFQAQAFVNATCFDGNTALHIACGRQNIGMVALLMAVGADPSIENYDQGEDSDAYDEVDDEVNEERVDRPQGRQGHIPEDFAMENQKVGFQI